MINSCLFFIVHETNTYVNQLGRLLKIFISVLCLSKTLYFDFSHIFHIRFLWIHSPCTDFSGRRYFPSIKKEKENDRVFALVSVLCQMVFSGKCKEIRFAFEMKFREENSTFLRAYIYIYIRQTTFEILVVVNDCMGKKVYTMNPRFSFVLISRCIEIFLLKWFSFICYQMTWSTYTSRLHLNKSKTSNKLIIRLRNTSKKIWKWEAFLLLWTRNFERQIVGTIWKLVNVALTHKVLSMITNVNILFPERINKFSERFGICVIILFACKCIAIRYLQILGVHCSHLKIKTIPYYIIPVIAKTTLGSLRVI